MSVPTTREARECGFLAGHLAILNYKEFVSKGLRDNLALTEHLFDAGSKYFTYIASLNTLNAIRW